MLARRSRSPEYARWLARRDDYLVLIARDSAELEKFSAELRSEGASEVDVLAADLFSPGATVTAVCPGCAHTDVHARLGLARTRRASPTGCGSRFRGWSRDHCGT